MKRSILILVLGSVLSLLVVCSSPNKVPAGSDRVHPHTALRKLEFDLIKVGDSLVKVEALMGKPTEKSSDPNGTVMTWYFAEDRDVPEQYYTLKEAPAPSEISQFKFLKLVFDPKNKVVSKDFKL